MLGEGDNGCLQTGVFGLLTELLNHELMSAVHPIKESYSCYVCHLCEVIYIGRSDGAARKDDESFYYIAQLADIARPIAIL